MDNNTKPKDPLINVRNVVKGKNSKGADRFQLYLGGETQYGNQAIQTLIDSLTAGLNNPKGVKIDLHVGRRTTNDGSREFDSAYFFVKQVEEGPSSGGRRPTNNVTSISTDKINAVKATLKG